MEAQFTKQERKDAKAAYLFNKRKNPVQHQKDREEIVQRILSCRIPNWNIKLTYL